MGLFRKRELTEAERTAENYNILGRDKRVHPDTESEEEAAEPEPEPEPEPEIALGDLDVASLKERALNLGLKQTGSREELLERIEEAEYVSEEEPDIVEEDAQKAVQRTMDGKKAKKQIQANRNSKIIQAEKEAASKERARIAAIPKPIVEVYPPPPPLVKRKTGCLHACYGRYILGLGKYKHVDYSEFTPYLSDFQHLGLEEPDVCRLLNIFLKIDGDRSGHMDAFEFFMWADIDRTPFAEKIFKIFDHDLSGELDFVEFVCAVWNFCTMDDSEVVSFAFECFGDRNVVTKEWKIEQEGVDLLTKSIFDIETQAYKTCKLFFDDVIYRNGKVTERDWTKWTQHNRRALRPLIDLRQSLRGKCIGKKWWKKLQAFRKKQFFRMRFHDIEKAIDSKRRRMNRKPLAQQKQENEVEQVFASRRTRQSRNSVEVGETEAQRLREEERLAKRQKPKRKKFKVVMRHGFEQSIPCGPDEVEEVLKNVSVDAPITVKRRRAKLKQRNRDQGIAVLMSLRSSSAAHEHARRARSPTKIKPTAVLDAAYLSGAAARHMVRRLGGKRPVYVPFTYNVLSEPSDLERASGVYHLGLIPTGDVVERARETLRLEA